MNQIAENLPVILLSGATALGLLAVAYAGVRRLAVALTSKAMPPPVQEPAIAAAALPFWARPSVVIAVVGLATVVIAMLPMTVGQLASSDNPGRPQAPASEKSIEVPPSGKTLVAEDVVASAEAAVRRDRHVALTCASENGAACAAEVERSRHEAVRVAEAVREDKRQAESKAAETRLNAYRLKGPGAGEAPLIWRKSYAVEADGDKPSKTASRDECERLCLADSACKLIEYFGPARRCSLYSHVPQLKPSATGSEVAIRE